MFLKSLLVDKSAWTVRSSANTELEVCSSVSDLMKPLHFVQIYLMAQKGYFLCPQTLSCPSPIKRVFVISQIVMEGHFWVFSLLAINIILLSFGSLLLPFGLMGPEPPAQGASPSQVGNCAVASAACDTCIRRQNSQAWDCPRSFPR